MVKSLTASPLGKKSAYIDQYTPSLLFPIPRHEKRLEIGINNGCPFQGVDIWNAFELSWLNPKGKPQVATAEFFIPCESKNLIESKSFKLYLNSYNQTSFESFDVVHENLRRDISEACGSNISVNLIPLNHDKQKIHHQFNGVCLDDLDIDMNHYLTQASYLTTSSERVEETLFSDLLKSNCLVTGQPDWGSVLIHYHGNKISHSGLLRYIISFRNHLEFHEQCVERIFMDIMRECAPKKLTVYARYTRRGGLDINPFRSNFEKPYANTRLIRQ